MPRSDRVYHVSTIGGRKTAERSIEYYRENFDYLIVNSFDYDVVLTDKEKAHARTDFYRDLEQQVELAAAFRPYSGATKPPFVYDQKYGPLTSLARLERPGPVVKIYMLGEMD